MITLIGNSSISHSSMKLTADTIYYYTARATLLATGNPRLIDKGDTVAGTYIAYNLDKQTGKLQSGKVLSTDEAYYAGQDIVRDGDSVYINNGTYTTCLHRDSAHSYFYSEQMKVIPNDKAVAKPFVLNIGDAPIITFPFFIIPLEKGRSSGWLTPRWGVGLNGKGTVDDIGYFWAVNDNFDLMAAGKVNNFESFMIKGRTRYAVKDKLRGSLYGDFLISDEYQGSKSRWSIKFDHDQTLLPDNSLTLRGSGTIVSDNAYFNDTRDDEIYELLNQQFSSNLSLTKRFLDFGGYTSVTWNRTQNTHAATSTQNLPAVNLTINRRSFFKEPLNSKDRHFWNDLGWSYSLKGNQQFNTTFDDTDTTQKTTFRGASHSVTVDMPTNIFRYFRLTPQFTLSQSIFDTYYSKDSRDSLVTDTLWEDTIHIDSVFLFDPGTIIDTLAFKDSVRFNPRDTFYTVAVHDTLTYSDAGFDVGQAHNIWWKTGAELSTDIFGNYALNGKKIKGIRHTFTPSLRYSFTPQNDVNVRYASFGISGPAIVEKQRQDLTIDFRNYVEAKVIKKSKDGDKSAPTEKVIRLLSFDLAGTYNLEDPDSLQIKDKSFGWHNLKLSAQIPTPVVSLNYNSRYTAYNKNNNGIVPVPLSHSVTVSPKLPAISGNLWSGDFFSLEKVTYDGYLDNLYTNKTTWRMTLNPNFSYNLNRKHSDDYFTARQTYNLTTGITLNFSHRWRVNWNGTWSFTENEFINQKIGLYADLECWEMSLDWYPTGVASGKVYFTVNLKKHRDVMWKQQEK